MSEKPNLTLPQRPAPAPKTPLGVKVALTIIILLNLTLLGALKKEVRLRPSATASSVQAPSPEAQKELALKLQKQGLEERAAAAWQDYLAAAAPPEEERGNLQYQIGKLYQEAGKDALALEAYYRAEQYPLRDEVQQEINQRTQECLEGLGKFAALRYELEDRVGLNGDGSGDQPVAEIGTHKITRAELDRRIEAEIDRQLEQMAAFLPEDQRNQQKESLLKQFSTDEARMQVLNQWLTEEMLYRRARESKIAEDPEVRDIVRDMERKILAQQVLARDVEAKIQITPGDVQTYYEANKTHYRQPERLRAEYVLCDSEADAQQLIDALNAGKTLADAAGNRVKEGAIERGRGLPEAVLPPEGVEALFALKAEDHSAAPIAAGRKFGVFVVHEKTPETQRTLDDVKQEVYATLRRQKQQEMQTRLLDELKQKYDVAIHLSSFAGQAKEEKADQ